MQILFINTTSSTRPPAALPIQRTIDNRRFNFLLFPHSRCRRRASNSFSCRQPSTKYASAKNILSLLADVHARTWERAICIAYKSRLPIEYSWMQTQLHTTIQMLRAKPNEAERMIWRRKGPTTIAKQQIQHTSPRLVPNLRYERMTNARHWIERKQPSSSSSGSSNSTHIIDI